MTGIIAEDRVWFRRNFSTDPSRLSLQFLSIGFTHLEKTSSHSGTIARSAGVVAAAVLCSRLLGLVREQVFAGLLGAGNAYDAFVVAFRIPNLLRDLFGEGALSAAFVTVFSDYDTNRSKEETWRLASTVLTFFAVALSLLSLLGIYLAGPIVHLLAPRFAAIAGKTELCVLLTRIMLPFLVFISLSAVVMGMLNTRGRFFIPSLASSFFNLGSIVGGITLAKLLPHYGQPAIVGMAIGTLIGGLMQLCVQLPTLGKTGFVFRPRLDLRNPGLHRILRLMVPATIGLAPVQLNIFINTYFASSCVVGSVSWLSYAFRLVQLPIGIFGVSLSIAMLPMLARQAARREITAMRTTLVSSLIMVLALTIPATAGLILLAKPIIRLIFEHGIFTAADTLATAHCLSLYAIGLFAYSANKIMVPAFYTLDETKYPVIASFLAIATNLIFINLLIARMQYLAIALSTSMTMLLNFLFLFVILNWKMKRLPLGVLLQGVAKIAAATLVMSAVVIAGKKMLAPLFAGAIAGQAVAVLATIATAALVYGLLLHLLGLTEMREIIDRLISRLRRERSKPQ